MAESGERRMLFDTRGRRKNVIRVVYAVLALLMGGSLFLTVGPFNISELLGNGGSSSDASEIFHKQSERIEGRLAKDPTNEALLLALTRARISAGNAQAEVDPRTGIPGPPPPEARDDFERARQAWNQYLTQAGGEPNPTAAQLVAITLFKLAESSTSVGDASFNIAEATKAQKIAAEQRPNVGSLTTLAIYQYYNGEYAAGDRTTKRATADAPTKAEAKAIEKQLAEYRKGSKRFQQQKKQLARTQKQAGGEQLQNPFGGLGPEAASPGE
jgi:hypothetical protein